MVGYGIGNLLRPFAGISQIVLALILMRPRRFCETRYLNLMDITINLNHIILQLGIVALAIAPDNIWSTIIVYQDCRIDDTPAMFGSEAIFFGEQRLAQRILVRTCNLVCDCHTDATPVG